MRLPNIGPRSGFSKQTLRLDIQILRALAVLSVVIFHSGGWLQGGYLGVDMFFAISGFVITGSILRDITAGHGINIAKFFLKRAKRLSLPLFVMLLFVLALSVFLYSPSGAQKIVSETSLGVLTLRANYVLASNTGGYFDALAEANPLLHTWSLAVEEQFYLGFPILIWILLFVRAKNSKATSKYFLIHFVTLVSFSYVAARLGGWLQFLPTSYFSPLNRVWEFSAGCSLAVILYSREKLFAAKPNKFLALVGLGMIFGGIIFAIPQGASSFLGQILVVFGILTVIYSRPNLTHGARRHKLTGIFLAVGNASYSLYLWHWPLIVFSVLIFGDTPVIKALGALVGIFLGTCAHIVVDQRMAKLPLIPIWPWFRPVLVAGLIAAAASISIYRYDMNQTIYRQWYAGDLYAYGNKRFFPCEISISGGRHISCTRTNNLGDIEYAVFGDSHAQQLFIGLGEVLPKHNGIVWATSSPNENNRDFQGFITFLNRNPSIRRVYFTERWLEKLSPTYVLDWQKSLTTILAKLADHNRTVLLVEDIPNFSFGAADCLAKPIIGARRCAGAPLVVPQNYLAYAGRLALENTNVKVLSIRKFFCGAVEYCEMIRDGKVLYSDSQHLNPLGAAYLANRVLSLSNK